MKKKDYKETKKVLKLKENKIRLFDLLLILIVYLCLFGILTLTCIFLRNM